MSAHEPDLRIGLGLSGEAGCAGASAHRSTPLRRPSPFCRAAAGRRSSAPQLAAALSVVAATSRNFAERSVFATLASARFMANAFHRNFFIAGPAGRLEALLWTAPAPDPPLVAVVCHPHPLFGGTMHNKVVYQAAKALHLRNLPVLRFNFRGAGQSEGVHDRGIGEQDDVRAALNYLAAEFPRAQVLLAGFSFGSVVGLRVGCADQRVSDLIGLGIPVNHSDLTYLRDSAKPKLIIQGGNDQFGSRANVEALYATLPEPKRLVIIAGADHFFAGQLEKVRSTMDAWLDERHPRAPAVGKES
jgi:uncharacterized protein